MKRKSLKFTSQWEARKGWEPTTVKPEQFDHIEKIGRVNDKFLFVCISAFGENHILTGTYEKI